MEQVCVGVDIGGTSVKLGIFTLNGNLLKKWEIPTEPKNDPKALIEKIGKSIKETLKEARLTLTDCVGVGMGVPGPVMPNGFIEVVVNIGWREVFPARILSDLLAGMPVALGNDANVAALGEAWMGGAKHQQDSVMVTLGTGVGGGIIIDGKIVPGKHGLGGEIGHMHVRESETEKCNCGGTGCLEQISSATGIVREAKRLLATKKVASRLALLEDITAKDVLDAAKAGDEIALEVVDTVSKYLGIALSHLAMTVDPEVFVIGGGVSKAGDFLIDKIREKFEYYTPITKNKADIVLAKLGNDAGIYGAAKLVLG